jgi:hypothetical protein
VFFLEDLEDTLVLLGAIFLFFTVTRDGFLSLELVASESEASSDDVELDSISAFRSWERVATLLGKGLDLRIFLFFMICFLDDLEAESEQDLMRPIRVIIPELTIVLRKLE